MSVRNYPRLGERVTHTVLPNGLHLYHNHRPDFGKHFAFFATKYGGMDTRFRMEGAWRDTPAGVAHFLEHKLFDTESGNALQDMAALGASPNAFTASGITGYFFECTEHFGENLRTLLSFVSTPYFTKESVEKEQGIIAQEIDMRRDTPTVAVFLSLLEALYHHHPVRQRVIGSVDSIRQITADTLYECHRAFYRPSNMVLCTAGSGEAEAVTAMAAEILPGDGGAPVARDYGPPEPAAVARERVVRRMAVSAPLFQLGFKCPSVPAGAERLGAQVLGELAMGALLGESSPLYGELYEQGLISRAFGAGFECGDGYSFAYAGGESRDPEAVYAAVRGEVSRIASAGLGDDLWTRVKKAAYGGAVRALNSFEHTCIEQARGHFDGTEFLTFPAAFDRAEKSAAEALIRAWAGEGLSACSIIEPQPKEASK